MRNSPIRTGAVAVMAWTALVCGCREEPTSRPAKAKLMLFCGAGIKPAADALIAAFETENDVEIDPTYAGSSRLLGQIASHQAGDLYMPGAELYVDKAVEQGLADASTRRIVAHFIPVIFVAKGNPKGIKSLAGLTQKGLRVGLGDERACAVGKKSVKILAKSGLAADLSGNVVYKSGTVNELAVAIQLGNVDAVICWDAVARQFSADGDVVGIPPAANEISTIPIVQLNSSRYPAAARKFIEFATSARGGQLLKENGYTVALPAKQ